MASAQFLTLSRASEHIYADNFELKYGEFDWIYLSNLAGRFDVISKIIQESVKKGAKIAWNPGKKELLEAEKVRTLLRDIEILIVNKEEASFNLRRNFGGRIDSKWFKICAGDDFNRWT